MDYRFVAFARAFHRIAGARENAIIMHFEHCSLRREKCIVAR